MSMLLRPTRWFRARARQDVQSGMNEPVNRNMTVDYSSEDDDFTRVDVRPMTYAEAAHAGTNARVIASAPYSIIDESKLAVQMVEQYEAACNTRHSASPHVIANIEYGGDSSIAEPPRARKRRNNRHRSKANV